MLLVNNSLNKQVSHAHIHTNISIRTGNNRPCFRCKTLGIQLLLIKKPVKIIHMLINNVKKIEIQSIAICCSVKQISFL